MELGDIIWISVNFLVVFAVVFFVVRLIVRAIKREKKDKSDGAPKPRCKIAIVAFIFSILPIPLYLAVDPGMDSPIDKILLFTSVLMPIAAILLAIIALGVIRRNKNLLEGKRMATSSIFLAAISFFLLLVSIPSHIGFRSRAYEASAESVGRSGESAQKIFHEQNKVYAKNLDELLTMAIELAPRK